MKSFRRELVMHINQRRGFVNITPQVEAALKESGIREGLVLVNAMHITASVFINDDEAGLHRDFERFLERLAPEKPYSQYDHNGDKHPCFNVGKGLFLWRNRFFLPLFYHILSLLRQGALLSRMCFIPQKHGCDIPLNRAAALFGDKIVDFFTDVYFKILTRAKQ